MELTSSNILSVVPSDHLQLVAVDLPFITKSYDKAIEVLGGEDRLQLSLKLEAPTIQAHFNTHLFDKPIVADRISCGGILLKLKRKRKLDQISLENYGSSSSSTSSINKSAPSNAVTSEYINSAEVLGFVSTYYSFNSPCDYQFLSLTQDSKIDPSTILDRNILETVPPSFTGKHLGQVPRSVYSESVQGYSTYIKDRRAVIQKHQTEPRNLSGHDEIRIEVNRVVHDMIMTTIRNNSESIASQAGDKAVDADKDKQGEVEDKNERRRKIRAMKQPAMVVKFSDIPPSAPPEVINRRRSLDRFHRIKGILTELFNLRPIWLRKYLFMHPVLAMNQNFVKEILVQVCYCYQSGPYKGCLIRYGCNPTLDPKLRLYTMISFRFTARADSRENFKIYLNRITNHVISTYKSSQKLRVDLDRMEVQLTNTPSSSTSSSSSYVEIYCFGVELNTQINIDIPSIRTEALYELICTYPYMSSCSEFTGWLSKDMVIFLRTKIYDEIIHRFDQFLTMSIEQLPIQPLPSRPEAMLQHHDTTSSSSSSSLSDNQINMMVYKDLFYWQDRYAMGMNDEVMESKVIDKHDDHDDMDMNELPEKVADEYTQHMDDVISDAAILPSPTRTRDAHVPICPSPPAFHVNAPIISASSLSQPQAKMIVAQPIPSPMHVKPTSMQMKPIPSTSITTTSSKRMDRIDCQQSNAMSTQPMKINGSGSNIQHQHQHQHRHQHQSRELHMKDDMEKWNKSVKGFDVFDEEEDDNEDKADDEDYITSDSE